MWDEIIYPFLNFNGATLKFKNACDYINGLVQEKCNSIANLMELCFSCTNNTIDLSMLGLKLNHVW